MQLSSGDAPGIEIEKVGSGLQFVDGLAWARAGFLVAADVRQNKLYRFEGPGRPKILKENDGGVSGLAYDLQGRLYLCESVSRRVSRMDRQGVVEEFAAGYQGKKFNAPNDIVVRRDYQVFFTDPAFGSAADRRELDFNGIYHVTPKGDIDVGRNGETSNPRDLITKISGVPGGIKTDVEGRLYIAARGVSIYSQAGKFDRTILETENVANCAFGEADSEYLFMSARGTIFRAHIGVKGAFQY